MYGIWIPSCIFFGIFDFIVYTSSSGGDLDLVSSIMARLNKENNVFKDGIGVRGSAGQPTVVVGVIVRRCPD